MWPFTRSKPVHSCPSVAQLQQIAADNAELRLEWAEVLDKLQSWANRQTARDSKRVKTALTKATETDQDSEPAGEALPVRPPADQRSYRLPEGKAELRRRAAMLRNGD
jgi:hypothetical protein